VRGGSLFKRSGLIGLRRFRRDGLKEYFVESSFHTVLTDLFEARFSTFLAQQQTCHLYSDGDANRQGGDDCCKCRYVENVTQRTLLSLETEDLHSERVGMEVQGRSQRRAAQH
jgi:hypothetical protein